MNKSYTYSFIIPHKNSPELLSRCIDSIPERDDIQIIVVDDNSDEDKKPLLLRVDVELILISPSETKGAGYARNKGLSKASGKWILFPDCDDYYVDGFIEILDRYKDSNIDVLYFNFEYRDGKNGNLLPDLSFKQYFNSYDGSQISTDFVKYKHNAPWTKMVRHSMVVNYHLRFEEVPNGNDAYFSMMVGYYAKQIAVDKNILYVYLKYDNSISHNKKNSSTARLCKIEYRMKKNEFYKYIGYPEWQSSLLRVICGQIWRSKCVLIGDLLFSFYSIYKKRKKWLLK